MAIGALVSDDDLRRRIGLVDDAYAALVNATRAGQFSSAAQRNNAIAAAHAWVTWRRAHADGAIPPTIVNDLKGWAATYARDYAAVGSPLGAPLPDQLRVDVAMQYDPGAGVWFEQAGAEGIARAVPVLLLGLAGVILAASLFARGRA